MATDINNVDKSIEKFADEHSDTTAGMAVSIFNADEDIYSGYFGYIDKENSIEVDENSVFEWGSATKLLVWTSVMQLYEQGLIDLEADVKGYLPDNFFKNLRFDKPITMINLMNHNAGFQETVYNVFIKRDNIDNMKPLGELLSEYQPEQIFEPGTVTAYSNWGVAVAGYIVERITDKPFYEYVNENIFDPLGMDKSSLKPGFDDNEFVKDMVYGVVTNINQIDELANKYLNKWTIDRLGNTDQSILRMGIYELLYTDTPDIVAINEAVELAKSYSDDDVKNMINGVLDKLYHDKVDNNE